MSARPGAGEPPAFSRFFYAMSKFIFRLTYGSVWRLSVHGANHVPLTGALIVAPNHVSFADPPVVGCSLPRPLYFMAKEDLFRLPILGQLIPLLNAFPIKRGVADVRALRQAHGLLKSEKALLMFPEGTRQKNGELGRPRGGVGHLAVKLKIPVLPIYLHHSSEVWRLRKMYIYYGEPLFPEGDTDPQAFSEKVMAAIAYLKQKHLESTIKSS